MKLPNDEIISLIGSCATGDKKSLEKFFELYSEDIYNFPLKVFHLSEDDASDYFIYAFERLKNGQKFKNFLGKSSFNTWFYSVLKNMLIDWQRSKKELKIVNPSKINKDGKEYASIEDETDHSNDSKEDAIKISDYFSSVLQSLSIEKRVIFKLSYIYYQNLEADEIEYIINKTKISEKELQEKIIRLRDELSEKEIENTKQEDKITGLYLDILDLKSRSIQLNDQYEENINNIEKVEYSLKKKYEQRRKLIEKKQKGLFLAKTPYKLVANLLNISEGSISVTLLRIIENLEKKINLREINV